MKIALLLTGHYRTFDETFLSWKEQFIEKYSADVYMHIWDNVGLRTDLSKGEISPPAGALAQAKFSEELIDKNKIINEYGIKELVIENYKNIEEINDFKKLIEPVKKEFVKRELGDRRMLWFLSQYYKKKAGIESIESKNIEYDFIFVSRPDFKLGYFPEVAFNTSRGSKTNEINFSNFDKNKLYFSFLREEDEFHDFYMIGNLNNLKKCFKIYEDFELLFQHFKENNFSKMSCGHALLTTYVRKFAKIEIGEIGLLGYIFR